MKGFRIYPNMVSTVACSLLGACLLTGCTQGDMSRNQNADNTAESTNSDLADLRGELDVVGTRLDSARVATQLTGGSMVLRRVDAPAGKVFLAIQFTLSPPITLPQLPDELIATEDETVKITPEGIAAFRKKYDSLREKYSDELQQREQVISTLNIVLVDSTGAEYKPLIPPRCNYSTTEIKGSEQLFSSDGEALFEIPQNIQDPKLTIDTFRPVKVNVNQEAKPRE